MATDSEESNDVKVAFSVVRHESTVRVVFGGIVQGEQLRVR